MRTRRISILAALLCLVALAPIAGAIPRGPVGLPAPGTAGRPNETPKELEGVELEEHRGQSIPMDLTFTDQDGKTVRLGDYFGEGKPVILNLGYYRCPQLCGLILNGLSDVMQKMDWSAGEDFTIVTISVNPGETPREAKAKRDMMISLLGRDRVEGWHFLVGEKSQIQAVSDAAGWEYRYLPDVDQYAHPAALAILTPDGVISQYLAGIQYDPTAVRLALSNAVDGNIGSAVDQLVLSCFHLDPETGEYSLIAMKLMQYGGGLTLAVLALGIGLALVREWIKRRRERTTPDPGTPTTA